MIIGLLGRSRVGKDTVANELVHILGANCTAITRLSQQLKDAACSLYSFSREQVEDEAKEIVDPRYGVTPRVCIQNLCTHIMAAHGVDFFSKQLFQKYDDRTFLGKYVIIPDVRYEHDIHEIHKRGGIVIKIIRTSPHIPLHEWENKIDRLNGDYAINNDKDIGHLQNEVNRIVHNMKLS